MNEKRILAMVFAKELTGEPTSTSSLAKPLGTDASEVRKELDKLRLDGSVERTKAGYRLTPRGRKRIRVVFIGGGFEVLHPGHLFTVSEAKKLGDVLVVVAARDSTIKRRKGRDPLTSEAERVGLLAAMREVDAAILGGEGSIYDTLERVKPDIVALGYDQHHAEEEILKEAAKRGLRVSVVRLGSNNPRLKTSKFIQEI